MSYLAEIPFVGGPLAAAIPFVFVLAIVVFVHEYGHYIVARWCGIGAEAFSIGFGRELVGWTDKRGTRWKISAIPLGGYVRFTGDADASSSTRDERRLSTLGPEDRKHSFHHASVERRALTVAAGPVFNFLLSILIFAAIALGQGAVSERPVVGAVDASARGDVASALSTGDEVLEIDGRPIATFAALIETLRAVEGREVEARVLRDGAERRVSFTFLSEPRVDGVAPGGAAEAAGLQPGDVIVALDGAPIAGFADLQARVAAAGERPFTLDLDRDGARVSATLAARIDQSSGRPLIGVQKSPTEIAPLVEPVGPIGALATGVERTWMIIDLSLSGIAQVIAGTQPADEVLGGPIRIAQISGDAADQGALAFVGLIAVLSTSIGLINLFPIPILDGGHLMFYAFEKARGRPLRERWQEIGNGIGLALVLSLMLFATLNDIARL